MRGLDPRIHADWPQIDNAAWIAGSSPAMTNDWKQLPRRERQ
jgi:hypothetical protein